MSGIYFYEIKEREREKKKEREREIVRCLVHSSFS